MALKDRIDELRDLITEADEFEDSPDEPGRLDELSPHYPMAHKNSLGPGPKGRKFGGRPTKYMWHCRCPGGECKCDRLSQSTGKMLSKSWTVNKERKAKYDRMYKEWRAKKERKGKYAKTDTDVRRKPPPTSPHVGHPD